jgi:hypothetical protein
MFLDSARLITIILIKYSSQNTSTYDHRLRRTGHPVRSAKPKPEIGRLVVGWVTTSEYLLLYVFKVLFCCYGFSAKRGDPKMRKQLWRGSDGTTSDGDLRLSIRRGNEV